MRMIEEIDGNINKTTNKSRLSQLKRIRKEILYHYKGLGETFVDTDDKKAEILDELLQLKRRLASGEFKTNKLSSLK